MGKIRKIYVASSWRNEYQGAVVDGLRAAGHFVYDFKNPKEGAYGFSWSDIDANWMSWTAAEYREALRHPKAQSGFISDFTAMQWADTFVLVLPCGRTAHLEMGWAVGAGKETIILTRDGEEPELMAKMCNYICLSLDEVLWTLGARNGVRL